MSGNAAKEGVWPTGKEEHAKSGAVSEKNCVFRGSGMPADPVMQEEVLRFYEQLADPLCKGRAYRVPGMLATSMFEGVARGFLKMEDRIPRDRPKVLYKILLCRDEQGRERPGLEPMHLAFLDKTEGAGEYEFLFSAYSAFRVHSVCRSKHAASAARPHEIVLVACADNSTEDEDVPTCPWS
jgi:hypothetical protein